METRQSTMKTSYQPWCSSYFPLLRQAGLSSYLVSLLVIMSSMIVHHGEDIISILAQSNCCQWRTRNHSITVPTKQENEKLPFAIGEMKKGCDIFSGSWVRDKTRLLYDESCPYLQPQACQRHGRADDEYLHWRWQPHGCSIPSFNATLLLESLRGKRIMFVGDSLNREQYISFICLLHRFIPEDARSQKITEAQRIFSAKGYNITIEYYRAPLLLESNGDYQHKVGNVIVRNNSINKHGRHWIGADIIVFNTYLWWMVGNEINLLQGSFDDKEKGIVKLTKMKGYRLAISELVRWIEQHIYPNKTRVFFTSMSPTHAKVDWAGGDPKLGCYNETKPIEDLRYWGEIPKIFMQCAGEILGKSKVLITFLNITQLSSYRKDAHLSIYKKQWIPLTPEQIAKPWTYADCVHWCLPGLQDTWNELLFAKLFYP